MNPRDFSRALADLMRPRVIKASRYLDEHRDLEQLGMPIEIVRHAMDRNPIETAPGRAIEAWDGKGLLALHHARDNGKTHGAALWVRSRRRAGRRTVWLSVPGLLSWDALDVALAASQRAPAVVVDDVGTGLSGTDSFQTKLAAWLQERGHLPTILTSNANTAQLEHYLGARLVSRLRQAGKLASFEHEAGLREPDLEQLDDAGRGLLWQRATRMLWRLGCEPDDRFDPETNRVELGWRVGDALELARLGIDELHALAMSYGRTIPEVEAHAASMVAEAERVAGLIAGWTPPAMSTASTMAEIVDLADRDVRQEKARERLRAAASGIEPLELPATAPTWALEIVDDRARPHRVELMAIGFRVDPLGDGFVVKRRLVKDPKRALTMSPKLKTQPAAWDFAARLCGLEM